MLITVKLLREVTETQPGQCRITYQGGMRLESFPFGTAMLILSFGVNKHYAIAGFTDQQQAILDMNHHIYARLLEMPTKTKPAQCEYDTANPGIFVLRFY